LSIFTFIKDFQKIAKPLTHLLVKDVPFDFNEECLSAFLRLKEALILALVMQASHWGLPFKVMCDANDFLIRSRSRPKEGQQPICHSLWK